MFVPHKKNKINDLIQIKDEKVILELQKNKILPISYNNNIALFVPSADLKAMLNKLIIGVRKNE